MLRRQYIFQTPGTIIYDPHRPGVNDPWWCIVKTDEGVADYYRWLLERRYMIKTIRPPWGSHISIIRGEKPAPAYIHLWKKYHGQQIMVDCSGYICGNGEFWWINVYNPIFKTIRDEFHLPSQWGQHLSIAKIHEKNPVRLDQWCDDF